MRESRSSQILFSKKIFLQKIIFLTQLHSALKLEKIVICLSPLLGNGKNSKKIILAHVGNLQAEV